MQLIDNRGCYLNKGAKLLAGGAGSGTGKAAEHVAEAPVATHLLLLVPPYLSKRRCRSDAQFCWRVNLTAPNDLDVWCWWWAIKWFSGSRGLQFIYEYISTVSICLELKDALKSSIGTCTILKIWNTIVWKLNVTTIRCVISICILLLWKRHLKLGINLFTCRLLKYNWNMWFSWLTKFTKIKSRRSLYYTGIIL